MSIKPLSTPSPAKKNAPQHAPLQETPCAPSSQQQTPDVAKLREDLAKQDQVFLSSLAKKSKHTANLRAASLAGNMQDPSVPKPRNKAPALTSRLVNAVVGSQVMSILSEATTDMASLRFIASFGTKEDAEKAKSYLKSLEKLISRAKRKINSLQNEETMRGRQKKAEQTQKLKRAEAIKADLRKKMIARNALENSYLLDKTQPDYATNPALPCITEADIAQQTEFLLAAENAQIECAAAPEPADAPNPSSAPPAATNIDILA